jgi:integrase
MRDHLVMFGSAGLDDLIFTGEHGQPLRRSNFNKITRWKTAVAAAGLPSGFRFHDLRHTGYLGRRDRRKHARVDGADGP